MQPQEPTASIFSGTVLPNAAAVVPNGDPVFSTAHLVWLDLESGDELSIELFGPRPFLEELVAQGFRLQETAPAPSQPDLTDTQFRIRARVGRN